MAGTRQRRWILLGAAAAALVAAPPPASAQSCSGIAKLAGLCKPAAPQPGGEPPPGAAPCSWLQRALGRCPGLPAPAPAGVKRDGSLDVGARDGGLAELPPPVPGQPLWPRAADRLPYGLNGANGDVTPTEAGQIERGFGGSVHRVAISWPGVEHRPGTYDWANVDTAYRELVASGIRPLFVILRSPGEYVARKFRNTDVCGGSLLRAGRSCEEPPLDEHVGRLGEFARRVAVRYPLAAGIELWNEPNLVNHWSGTYPDPERYAAMLSAVWAAVKQPAEPDGDGGRPTMRVLGGSLNGRSHSNSTGLADWVFLRYMLGAGAGARMDGLAIHPYPYDASLSRMRSALARYEDELAGRPEAGTLRYAITEIGLSTGPAESTSESFTQAGQAAGLVEAYRLLDERSADMPGAERVDLAIFHSSVDPPGHEGFGLLSAKRFDGRYPAKAAWCAFRSRVAGLTAPVPAVVSVPAALRASC